jgi:uncharacterized protein
VFQVSLKRENIGGDMAVFPEGDGVYGAVISQEGYVPAANGAVIYLSAGADLNPALARAVAAGGSVITPKTALPPGMGYYAHFGDSEGNRIGLHSEG